MVEFHSHIISDLLDDPTGGLVVLSSGLSLPKLLSSLLSLHHSSKALSSSSPFRPSHHRGSLYSSGQVLSITPRILIVDRLTNKLPSSSLSSLILLNVHVLAETSTESFIVRILKSFSPSLPIYAITDRPHSMVAGFCKAERLMKALFIKRLHLWPRFQVYVSQKLVKDPEFVDVRVPMSKYMVGIQKAIVEVMDACLKEMRKTNKVDVEDLTVENGLFKLFDEIVRRQLDPIWHTLGNKMKQLVLDLNTLRKLLDYLVGLLKFMVPVKYLID